MFHLLFFFIYIEQVIIWFNSLLRQLLFSDNVWERIRNIPINVVRVISLDINII